MEGSWSYTALKILKITNGADSCKKNQVNKGRHGAVNKKAMKLRKFLNTLWPLIKYQLAALYLYWFWQLLEIEKWWVKPNCFESEVLTSRKMLCAQLKWSLVYICDFKAHCQETYRWNPYTSMEELGRAFVRNWDLRPAIESHICLVWGEKEQQILRRSLWILWIPSRIWCLWLFFWWVL